MSSSRSHSLKEQNAWLIRAVLVLHAVAFAFVAFEPVVSTWLVGVDALDMLNDMLVPGSLSLATIALAKLLLLGLIPAGLRDRLIHWRWLHPLPGSRAFIKLAHTDPRVSLKQLSDRFGPLPEEPGDQNRLFYKLYRTHSDDVGVLDAHKSYLAARDIGIINLILLFLLPWFAWWANGDLERTAAYGAALFLAYVLAAVAAQVYSARFVVNVLAAASAQSA